MAQVNTTTMPVKLQDYYDKVALEKAVPLLLYRKFAQIRPLPKNSGEIIRFKRWGTLPPATTPLQEGVTPVGNSISVTEITATVVQYGDWVPVTDKVQLLYMDPILTEIVEQLGEQQGETMDVLMRDQLAAGSNVRYANGVKGRDSVVAAISTTDLEVAIRALKNANARQITNIIKASTGIATTPIRPAFVAICHPNTTYTLEGLTGWVPVEKYASQTGVMEGEVGAFKGVRFIETTNALAFADAGGNKAAGMLSTSGVKNDVYATIIFAQNAYGEVPLSGSSSSVIIKVHGDKDTSDTSDPLNQRGSAGWKTIWTGKILNDSWMIRIEHAVAA